MAKKTKTITAEANEIPGKILPPSAMILRQHIGRAEHEGNQYEMSFSLNNGAPIVFSKTTGKWFMLPWEDVLKMAQERGIDQP